MIILTMMVLTVVIHTGSSFDYVTDVGIPAAERRLEMERRIMEGGDGIDTRISGGDRAYHKMFPWLAGILSKFKHRRSLCSGSLLNSVRVLTAAHCLQSKNGSKYTYAKYAEVVLGSDYVFYGGFRLNSTFQTNPDKNIDIALVYLPISVNLGGIVQPIALPINHTKELFIGYTAYAAGYGYLRSIPDVGTEYNQFIALEIVDKVGCNYFTYARMCTSARDPAGNSLGPIKGDSGGPLSVRVCGQNILVGVVRSGIEAEHTSYIRVTEVLDFISAYL